MATYDVVVVGAGHAGVEAAWAAARLGRSVAICTLSDATVAHMPCNPAIGGTAKGHLVREIDALGGLMGVAIDATGIQFKVRNTGKGMAVRGPRCQSARPLYRDAITDYVRAQARERLGFVLPCEVGYVVVDENGATEPVTTTEGIPVTADGPWYSRLWASLEAADVPRADEAE